MDSACSPDLRLLWYLTGTSPRALAGLAGSLITEREASLGMFCGVPSNARLHEMPAVRRGLWNDAVCFK